jgi:hypothetical protein
LRTSIAIVFLSLAGSAVTGVAAESYEALFESAVRAVTWDLDDQWAFTETKTGSDGTFVSRYEPRLPKGERWSLLSVDGRAPTSAEAEDFARNRAEGERDTDDEDTGENTDDRDVDAMVEPGTLRLVEETDAYWLLGFVPTDDDDDDDDDDQLGREVMRRMLGTVKITKEGGHLAAIEIRNDKPIRPKVGVKMKRFLMRMTFAPAIEGGPVVMKSMDFAIKLSAFMLIRVNESESVTYSDFEYAGDWSGTG